MLVPIILVGILFMANRAYNVAQAAQQLTAAPGKIRVLGFDQSDFKNVKLEIGIVLTNKTNSSIPVDRLSGDIFHKGKLIGTYLIPNRINIEANKSVLATIDSSVNYVNFLTVLSESVTSKTMPDITTTGSIKTLGVTIPFNFNITALIV